MRGKKLWLYVILLLGVLMASACQQQDKIDNNNSNETKGELETYYFKGTSIEGDPALLFLRFAENEIIKAKQNSVQVEWDEVNISVAELFLSDALWQNTNLGYALASDKDSINCKIVSKNQVELQLQLQSQFYSSSLDFRLPENGMAFSANGKLENGSSITVKTDLSGLLSFTPSENSFYWDGKKEDHVVAAIDLNSILTDDMVDKLKTDSVGNIVIDQNNNNEYLQTINYNIISAFNLYQDLNANGELGSGEISLLYGRGNPNRSKMWDVSWPSLTCGDSWENLTQFEKPILTIGGFGENYGIALDETGTYLFDGTSWTLSDVIYPGRYGDLPERTEDDIYVRGLDDVYLADDSSSYHYNGAGWETLFKDDYSTIWASGPDDIWIINRNVMHHFDGTQWTDSANPQCTTYNCDASRKLFLSPAYTPHITGTSSDDIWLFNNDHKSLWHYNGAVWTNEEELKNIIQESCRSSAMSTMVATGPNNLWTYCSTSIQHIEIVPGSEPTITDYDLFDVEGFTMYTNVEHFIGEPCDPETNEATCDYSLEINKMYAISPNDIWAIGEYGLILHFDGTQWTKIESGVEDELLSIWAISSDNIWVGGGLASGITGDRMTSGRMLHWNGEQLTGQQGQNPTSSAIIDFYGNHNDQVHFLDFKGKVFENEDNEWQVVSEFDDVSEDTDFSVFSAKHFGNNHLYMLLGDNSYEGETTTRLRRLVKIDGTEMTVLASLDGFYSWYDIFVASPNNIWISGGYDVDGHPAFAHYQNGEIEIIHINENGELGIESSTYFHIAGTSSNNIWAFGSKGEAIFYNGQSWTPFTIDVEKDKFPVDANINSFVTDVWVASHNDVWAVGVSGILLHFNGEQWQSVSSGTAKPLFGIWGTNHNNIYAVGSEGTVLHYDGTNWNTEANCSRQSLFSVWGTGGEVWVGGTNGTILHYNSSHGNN